MSAKIIGRLGDSSPFAMNHERWPVRGFYPYETDTLCRYRILTIDIYKDRSMYRWWFYIYIYNIYNIDIMIHYAVYPMISGLDRSNTTDSDSGKVKRAWRASAPRVLHGSPEGSQRDSWAFHGQKRHSIQQNVIKRLRSPDVTWVLQDGWLNCDASSKNGRTSAKTSAVLFY